MKGQTSKVLRIVLLIYAIYMALYGVLHVFFPKMAGPLDPATTVLFGVAAVAFAFGAFLAYLEKAWDKVRIVVMVEVVWMVLYTIAFFWGLLTGGIPAEIWIIPVIGAVFAILLLVLYIREERIQK
jgi:hypothetical protein